MDVIYNRRNSIFRICREEEHYPERMGKLKGMPPVLWGIGRLPEEHRPTVAIVGARRSTVYGNETARYFARELAGAGVQIISGLAWGIDGMAHEGALEAGGDTFAVEGCGVDICYPSGHRALYEKICETGGVLSEQPPGKPPLAHHFPARNRMISALSDLVLVVEAREKSGSLITADFALEQGKDVWAVPGRITDELSRGCLDLIRQGAGVADSPETILEALGISEKKAPLPEKNTKILLAKEENIVYSWIRLQPASLEELVRRTGFPASNGHVRDFPKSQFGIDVDHDYEPKYITIRGKGDILAKLRKEAKKADKVYLATDPDREGEAISWHLSKALGLEDKKMYRITFNEITKSAVKDSIKHAREIDMDLVDAQQARRMVDRMVGYRISPILWAKVKRGLSAGRVQSVALRLIADREEEINAFIPEEYWSLDAEFQVKGEKKPLTAKFYGTPEEKKEIHSREEMDQVLKALDGAAFSVTDVKKGERTKKAPLPFTTSTLQQEASKVLNFSTSKTMRLAQQLYEGIDIEGQGTVGIITYLRTDSTRISDEAAHMAESYIGEQYGENYLRHGETKKATGKKIQDAHEAIRPTDISRLPISIKESLSRDQYRLYQLIWKRFTASCMADARYNTMAVKIDGGGYRFTVSASSVAFDGFMSVYTQEDDEKGGSLNLLKELGPDSELTLKELEDKQHFTQPPAHYTEAALVKTLEELGIGRPSTYAPTISTIIARRYVAKEGRNLYLTELGEVVNNMMKQAFPSIVEPDFTANVESLLDMVEEGKVSWKTVVSNFYPDLAAAVEKAEADLEKVQIQDEVSDVVCEQCGRNMVVKYGPHGKFLACPGFPECRNTKPYLEKIGVKCPKCGKEVVLRRSSKGRKFYSCEGYPDCDYVSWKRPEAPKEEAGEKENK